MKASDLNSVLKKIYNLANDSVGNAPLVLGEDEELNSIIDALNFLEVKILKDKKNAIESNDLRLLDMQEVLNSYLSRDFTPKAKMSGTQDEIDALALSVNYFGQEMMESFAQINKQQKDLEVFNQNLEDKVKARTKELEKAQKELEQSLVKEKELGEMKSRFVATASHQFRTPLTIIRSSLGFLNLQKEKLGDEFQPLFVRAHERINRQIENMTNLMDEVLVLEKINVENRKPNFEPVQIVSLCEEISRNYNEIQLDKREMKIDVNGESRPINLDREQIEHALSNLISNAFKYSINRPAPLMMVSFNDADIHITIEDYGIGIPENEVSHLFEPFYRASNVLSVTGSGLGTSIAKEYIEKNQGEIIVETKENEGSKFTVIFKS